MIYKNDRKITQRIMKNFKPKMTILLCRLGSYRFNSPRKIQDGRIKRRIIEIKRVVLKFFVQYCDRWYYLTIISLNFFKFHFT